VDSIADLELGLTEELAVGLGGEQLGDAPDFVPDGGEQASLDPVGFVALLGGQIEWESGHRRGLP
jgi:hypothetical protein